MMRKNVHPAVLATLSTSLFMLPTTAHAATALDTVTKTLASVGPSWGVYMTGMVAGASLYHVISTTRAHRKECEEIAQAFNIAWSTQDNCDYEEAAERYIQMKAEQHTWQETLSAIDERAQESTDFSFIDIVGGSDTLDEPEGLEFPTISIPSQAAVRQPEIVDTDSYVDYLIRDEFARNSSKAAQKSSQSFLKVIEGGSQAMPRLSVQSATKQAPLHAATKQGPRHFAHNVDYGIARRNSPHKQGPRHFAHDIAIEA